MVLVVFNNNNYNRLQHLPAVHFWFSADTSLHSWEVFRWPVEEVVRRVVRGTWEERLGVLASHLLTREFTVRQN